MAATDRDPLDRFNDYLDRVARGEEPRAYPEQMDDLDPALAETVQRLRMLEATMGPDPALASHIWEELMNQASLAGAPRLRLSERFAPATPDGRAARTPWRTPRALPGWRERRRWAFAHVATALLLLVTLVTAYVAFRPGQRTMAPLPAVIATPTTPPSPPAQPATGPGGADYRFAEVIATDHGGGGKEAEGYWLFEPAGSADEALPVVVFLHDQGEGQPPDSYRAWIDHLVRRGAIVIYPSQLSMFGQTNPAEALGNIQAAVQAALTELGAGVHARPDPARMAIAGHGPGATLAVDYAASAAGAGLPAPGAVLAAFPNGRAQANLSAIDPETRLVIVAGRGDLLDEDPARRLWAALAPAPLASRPVETRAYIRLVSDDHGEPPLSVDYYAPMARPAGGGAGVDAFDWYGTWKLLDGLMGCAFTGEWCEYALGDSPEQRFMGTWSDGVPVATAQVAGDLGTPAP